MDRLAQISEHNIGNPAPLDWEGDFMRGSIAWDAKGPDGEGQNADGTPWGSVPTTIYKAAAVRAILTLPTTHRAHPSIQ